MNWIYPRVQIKTRKVGTCKRCLQHTMTRFGINTIVYETRYRKMGVMLNEKKNEKLKVFKHDLIFVLRNSVNWGSSQLSKSQTKFTLFHCAAQNFSVSIIFDSQGLLLEMKQIVCLFDALFMLKRAVEVLFRYLLQASRQHKTFFDQSSILFTALSLREQ